MAKGDLIQNELENVNQIIFVTEGYYKIGFKMNYKSKYRMIYRRGTYIGGFELAYNQQSSYEYMTHTDLQGFFIKRADWKMLIEKFP